MDVSEITNLEIIWLILTRIYFSYGFNDKPLEDSLPSNLLRNIILILDIKDDERECTIKETLGYCPEILLSEVNNRTKGLGEMVLSESHHCEWDFDKMSDENLAFVSIIMFRKLIESDENFKIGPLSKLSSIGYCECAINLFLLSTDISSSDLACVPLDYLERIFNASLERGISLI